MAADRTHGPGRGQHKGHLHARHGAHKGQGHGTKRAAAPPSPCLQPLTPSLNLGVGLHPALVQNPVLGQVQPHAVHTGLCLQPVQGPLSCILSPSCVPTPLLSLVSPSGVVLGSLGPTCLYHPHGHAPRPGRPYGADEICHTPSMTEQPPHHHRDKYQQGQLAWQAPAPAVPHSLQPKPWLFLVLALCNLSLDLGLWHLWLEMSAPLGTSAPDQSFRSRKEKDIKPQTSSSWVLPDDPSQGFCAEPDLKCHLGESEEHPQHALLIFNPTQKWSSPPSQDLS